MKAISRILIVVWIAALLVAVVPANAQEDVYAGFFIQKAESGTMTDNGDGTYTLALQGVGNSFEWLVTSPNAGLGYVDDGEVALDWASRNPGRHVVTHVDRARIRFDGRKLFVQRNDYRP
jgi:hypothetical protein